jgi:hypothetical protein
MWNPVPDIIDRRVREFNERSGQPVFRTSRLGDSIQVMRVTGGTNVLQINRKNDLVGGSFAGNPEEFSEFVLSAAFPLDF